MSYKYSNGGFTVQGDIKAAEDAERNTIIDFGEDLIQLQTSGSTRLHIDNDGVYIPDTNADTSLRVSGAVEITPGDNAGLTFKKGESELNFISFKNASDGASYNARLAYQAAEHLFIAPGRGADFYINSSQNSGDATFPFRIMDDGTARFEKGLTDGSTSSTNLDSSISFYVSGTLDGNNNAVFDGNVMLNGTTLQASAQRVATTVASSFPYTVAEGDYVILVEGTGSPRTIDLPAKANHAGRVLIIKDATGNASSNNIEIDPNGSETIDGTSTKLMSGDKSSLTIVCGSDQWFVLGNYPG